MKRREPTKDPERISLFPFLAVLLCTMGSLLVLLIVVSQRAQANAEQEQSDGAGPASHAIVAAELEKIQQFLGRLHEARDQLKEQLTADRQKLSHLEDHTRRLRDQIQRLRDQAAQLNATDAAGARGRESLLTEAARLEKLAEESARLLAETERQASGRPSYAIVPYDGPNGTRRRPIYLECLADAVILQPEGITLRSSDFKGPLGPNNPLASALRAATEYHATSGHPGTAYPLFIVRPSGIRAYYAARAALESWNDDFGYELVDDDWKLKYPPADIQLAERVEAAVTIARRRMEFRAGSGRGFGGSGGIDGDEPGSGFGEDDDFRGSGGGDGGRGSGASTHSGGQGSGSRDAGGQGYGGGDQRGPNPGGNASAGGAGQGSPYGGPHAPGGAGTIAAPGGAAGTAPGGQPGGDLATPLSPHGTPIPLGLGRSSAAGTSSSPAEEATSGLQSMAAKRGKNWALPDATRGAIGVTRPLRIEVAADRVLVYAGDVTLKPREIPFTDATQKSMEHFVSEVWEQMRGWGIAGRGMYWRPVLNIHILQGGERRAIEMKDLLAGSGLDVRLQP